MKAGTWYVVRGVRPQFHSTGKMWCDWPEAKIRSGETEGSLPVEPVRLFVPVNQATT